MKRQLPIAIAFGIGLFMMVQYFIPHRYVQLPVEEINRWANLVWAAALILGTLSLARHLLNKISKKSDGWGFAVVAMVAMLGTIVAGFWGQESGSPFMMIFEYVLAPMEATTFSLLAFYIASAAFRAFRARNVEATLLLLAATFIMIGRVPIGHAISSWLPATTDYILDFPNTAAKRAIMIGVGLGMVSTALKIILGIERGYLGDKG